MDKRRNDFYERRRENYNRRSDDQDRRRDYKPRQYQRDRRFNEEPDYTRNYRSNSLNPREHRGFRDDRNYRMNRYNGYVRRDFRNERRSIEFKNERIPSKEEMDAMLKTYLETEN
ncbi:hypothetical protein TUBRATIS_14890 [Tubulinosema ratisbonensis]|uniref:Uncharacterized protein n=1 Tax=Tubulinosema ratisbonensis TaxID=291195 RepID=A0A437AIJ6_9MICR|nr:hypothetical protein TUBRATIS_26600 [Tubulinosema ratisbonensis]RVD92022.1 hypothetical protein TUBRATIS_14890 [Tubulinosema ratisbonensis]